MTMIRGLRWWVVALICLGTIINYLPRNALGVLAPTAARLRSVRSAVVGGGRLARRRNRLAFPRRRPRFHGAHGSGGDPVRHEGGRGMVPRQGKVDRRRFLQCRHVVRSGGLGFTLLVGALADTLGYGPLFGLLGVFDLIGAAALILLIRGDRAGARVAVD
jgi:hypothetical protein